MDGKKLLLIITSVLLVLAIPVLFFSEHRQTQIESWVTGKGFGDSKMVAGFIITGLFSLDILLPIPSTAVCAVAGKIFGIVVGTGLCWLGLNLSALVGYSAAYFFGWPAVNRFSSEQQVLEIKTQFDRWGMWPLVAFRAFPVLAEASILMLGMYRYPAIRFWPPLILTNLVVAFIFVGMGKWFSDRDQFILGIVLACVIPLLMLGGWSWWQTSSHVQDRKPD